MNSSAEMNISLVGKTGKASHAEVTNVLIQSLNFLIDEAENSKLSVPARIIRSARSDILNWVSYAYPADDVREKLVSSAAEHDGLLIAADLISKYASVRDGKLKKQIYNVIGKVGKKRRAKTDKSERKK